MFTPSILTILGIILFRRLGYVVGNAGVLPALGMLALATAISVNTSMSLSAIATSRRVRGGGDYYLISRSLGVEYGGALGVLLFLAQAVSVAFYCVGFGEGVAAIVGGRDLLVRMMAVVAAVGLFGLAYAGADLATRFQYVIMAILAAALASFFLGAYAAWDPGLLRASLTPSSDAADIAFWPLFAIFFPAVTGFTQGVSMSGDLEDASRSLPRGAFLAVGLSTVVYGAAIVMFAAARPFGDLAADYESMGRVASVGWLIVAGGPVGDPVLGAGVVSRRPTYPAGARQRPAVHGAGTVRRGRHRQWQPAPRGGADGADRRLHDRRRRPQRHCDGRVDVLPDLVRAAQLRNRFLSRMYARRASPLRV